VDVSRICSYVLPLRGQLALHKLQKLPASSPPVLSALPQLSVLYVVTCMQVYHDAVGCRCVLPPPPIPSTLPPPFALVSLRSPPKAPSPSAPTPLSSISKAAHIGSMVQLAETKMHNNWPEPSPVMERQAPRTFFALGAEKLLSLSERVPVSPARRPGITDLINHPSQATLQVPTVFAVLVGCGLMTLLLRRYAIIDETSCPESDTIHIHSVEDRRKVDLL